MADSPLFTLPDLIKANADAARAEGEAALNAARAERERALADGDEARAQAVWSALSVMQRDFAGLEAECERDRAIAEELSRKAHAASMLLQGVPIAAYLHAADAYRYFVRQAVLDDGTGPLFGELPYGRVSGDQFFINESPGVACFVPQDRATNPLELVDWALGNHCLPRQGTHAYRAFVTVFRAIADVFRRNIEASNARAVEARSVVFSAWKPGGLLVQFTPAAEKPGMPVSDHS